MSALTAIQLQLARNPDPETSLKPKMWLSETLSKPVSPPYSRLANHYVEQLKTSCVPS
jgi:hypothetical protein